MTAWKSRRYQSDQKQAGSSRCHIRWRHAAAQADLSDAIRSRLWQQPSRVLSTPIATRTGICPISVHRRAVQPSPAMLVATVLGGPWARPVPSSRQLWQPTGAHSGVPLFTMVSRAPASFRREAAGSPQRFRPPAAASRGPSVDDGGGGGGSNDSGDGGGGGGGSSDGDDGGGSNLGSNIWVLVLAAAAALALFRVGSKQLRRQQEQARLQRRAPGAAPEAAAARCASGSCHCPSPACGMPAFSTPMPCDVFDLSRLLPLPSAMHLPAVTASLPP
jgi:hypothetical protein